MTKIKVFIISFLCTIAVFLPIYLLVYAFSGAVKAPNTPQTVTESQSGVLVTNPMPSDTQTMLLMVGDSIAANASSYTIIQFNAVNNTIAVTSMPPQTVVLSGGKAITLQEAVVSAGPSQAAAALSETLGVEIKDYIFVSPDVLWTQAQVFGNITLMLDNYVDKDFLSGMGFINTDTMRYTVSPLILSQILSSEELEKESEHEIRSLAYSAFLAAGHGRLSEIIPAAIGQMGKSVATNISATKLFSYERTLEFLDKQQPTYYAKALPGEWAANMQRFELNEQTLELMREDFGAQIPDDEPSEEDLEPVTSMPYEDEEFVVENSAQEDED